MKIKKWFVTFCLFFVVCMIWNSMEVKAWWDPEYRNKETVENVQREWDTTTEIKETIGAFTYRAYSSKDGMSVWIYKIGVDKTIDHTRLEIPDTIQKKTVTKLGDSLQIDNDRIFNYEQNLFGTPVNAYEDWETANHNSDEVNEIAEIILPETVEVIQPYAFDSMDGIQKIKIPDKVKKITRWTFYSCKNLKEVILPESLEYLNPSAFEFCKKLEKFTISSENRKFIVKKGCVIDKRKQALVCVTGKKRDVFKIPKGIKVIQTGALGNCSANKVEIPASVTKIEPMAFERSYQENRRIKDVTVSKKNKVYAKDGQCIYDKKKKSLVVAIPRNRKLRISDKIQIVDESEYSTVNISFMHSSLKAIIYPKKLKTLIVGTSRFGTDKLYYTASNPPKLKATKDAAEKKLELTPPADGTAGSIYVPRESNEKYRKWYKKYDGYELAKKSWHTYDPATLK